MVAGAVRQSAACRHLDGVLVSVSPGNQTQLHRIESLSAPLNDEGYNDEDMAAIYALRASSYNISVISLNSIHVCQMLHIPRQGRSVKPYTGSTIEEPILLCSHRALLDQGIHLGLSSVAT